MLTCTSRGMSNTVHVNASHANTFHSMTMTVKKSYTVILNCIEWETDHTIPYVTVPYNYVTVISIKKQLLKFLS